MFEELLWRGLLLDATGQGLLASGLGACGFGIAHLYALPGGATDAALTTVFALIATALRWVARSRLLPAMVVHAIADLFMLTRIERLWSTTF